MQVVQRRRELISIITSRYLDAQSIWKLIPRGGGMKVCTTSENKGYRVTDDNFKRRPARLSVMTPNVGVCFPDSFGGASFACLVYSSRHASLPREIVSSTSQCHDRPPVTRVADSELSHSHELNSLLYATHFYNRTITFDNIANMKLLLSIKIAVSVFAFPSAFIIANGTANGLYIYTRH